MEEVKRKKRVKEFMTELAELEESTTKAILQLFKALKMIATLAENKEISKENLISDEIQHYKRNKMQTVIAHFKTLKYDLIEEDSEEEDFDTYHYMPKKKKAKEPKKSTIQETYELWQQNMSIDEIAKARVLTKNTIYGHFTKLIQAKTVSVHDLLPEDKISELNALFEGYNEESLSPLKEKVGDLYSWEELRLFKAAKSLV